MQDDKDKRGPGIKFPPPLLVVLVIGIGALLEWIFPLTIGVNEALWFGGLTLVSLAILLALVALVQFIRAGTAVEPWHPTTTIIQQGVFGFSRNPIYLAFCIATAGIGLMLNSWWLIAGVPVLVYLLYRLVIQREERYLQNKFGHDYLDYKNRVRRWL